MKKLVIAALVFTLMGLVSCDLINPVACTEQFETISIEVTGVSLDKTYTTTAQNDTLQKSEGSLFGNNYTVIDDSNQEELESEELPVNFHGYVGDSLVVNEEFVVGADVCHVYKVSGKARVDL